MTKKTEQFELNFILLGREALTKNLLINKRVNNFE